MFVQKTRLTKTKTHNYSTSVMSLNVHKFWGKKPATPNFTNEALPSEKILSQVTAQWWMLNIVQAFSGSFKVKNLIIFSWQKYSSNNSLFRSLICIYWFKKALSWSLLWISLLISGFPFLDFQLCLSLCCKQGNY